MNKKGFTVIELLVVMSIVFIILLILVVPFVLPFVLDKYIGDAKITDSNLAKVQLVNNVATVKAGERFKVEIEPPFISDEEVSVKVLEVFPDSNIVEQFGDNNKFWFKWTPKYAGEVEATFEFSDSSKTESSKILIQVVE